MLEDILETGVIKQASSSKVFGLPANVKRTSNFTDRMPSMASLIVLYVVLPAVVGLVVNLVRKAKI